MHTGRGDNCCLCGNIGTGDIREFFTDNHLFSIFFVTNCSQKVNKNTQHENKPTK